MFFPGDVFRYYLDAEDSDGTVFTLPGELPGFMSGDGYDPAYTVYALPSIVDGGGGDTQPSVLFVDDSGGGFDDTCRLAFAQNGLRRGVDYDTYRMNSPEFTRHNGIGGYNSGANVAQLQGYSCIVHVTGSAVFLPIQTGGAGRDLSADLEVLTGWQALPRDRFMAHFGDNLASGVYANSPEGQTYVHSILAVQVADADVHGHIDDQLSPTILPLDGAFLRQFVAYAGCPTATSFDEFVPIAPAMAGHGYEILGAPGTTYPSLAASVIHDRVVGPDRKLDVTFALDLARAQTPAGKTGESAPALLLGEVLAAFGGSYGGGARPLPAPTSRTSPASTRCAWRPIRSTPRPAWSSPWDDRDITR